MQNFRVVQALGNASSPWRGHTEAASAKPVSSVPAAQGDETESGSLLPAVIIFVSLYSLCQGQI